MQKSWGHYPNGIVSDTDEECEKVVARTDDADLEEVFEMVNFIQVRKHAIGVDAESPYGFLGNNCVDRAIAWYRQFDEERAAELDDIGQEPDTPGNLCEDITDRRKASDGD